MVQEIVPDANSEGDELSEVPIEEEIAYASRIAALGLDEFREQVMPEAIAVDGMEAAQESSSYLARFEAFVADLGIRHFAPHEFLMMGSSNAPGNRCAGRNVYPPESAWQTMAPSARMLDAIRTRLGAPVIILSGYRSDSYNRCIGGASQSQHKRFSAFDFVGRSGTVRDWWEAARAVRAGDNAFAGGIGRYRTFVHIDTRGHNADW
jgi:N-acetylmuramoyl-L-alanine amidase